MHGTPQLTPEILLRAYAEGLFPMAERRGDPTLYWVSPEKRGVIPLDAFHVVLGGQLETSNVDMAGEFANMITTQRAFQASARIITTTDEMLQEVVNLKH